MPKRMTGTLTVCVEEGRNLKNHEFYSKTDPYIQLQVGRELPQSTSVVSNTTNPRWDQTIVFKNVTFDDQLKVELMDKGRGTETDHMVGQTKISSKKWGASGSPMRDRYVLQSQEGKFAGEVNLTCEWDINMRFRQPFALVSTVATLTRRAMRPLDPVVDKLMHWLSAALLIPIGLITTIFERTNKAQKWGLGLVTLVALFFTVMSVLIPAVIFLPVTLFFGFLLTSAAVVALPVALLVGWLLVCSNPVQVRVVHPVLIAALERSPRLQQFLLTR